MEKSEIAFGWYPKYMNVLGEKIRIETLSDIEIKINAILNHKHIKNEWIYSDSNRIFSLPQTHQIYHERPCNEDNLKFLVWSLSYFLGMRLTSGISKFLDATPIAPYKLTDFIVDHREIPCALELADDFFRQHQKKDIRSKLWIAALHAIFLAQYPLALQFERFTYLYSAIDACFALSNDIQSFSRRKPRHSERIHAMCDRYGMTTPEWGRQEVVDIRNNLIHECLYIGEPLGFQNYRVASGINLNLEMQNLVCRFLAAILGNRTYSQTPVGTYQMQGWF